MTKYQVEISVTVHKPELTMSVSGRASQNQGRRTDVREVNQVHSCRSASEGHFKSTLLFMILGRERGFGQKAMNAPDHPIKQMGCACENSENEPETRGSKVQRLTTLLLLFHRFSDVLNQHLLTNT